MFVILYASEILYSIKYFKKAIYDKKNRFEMNANMKGKLYEKIIYVIIIKKMMSL